MSFFSWAPWKILIKYASRRYGIINPLDILAKMRSFAQPSEVAEPMELVRAGILFHARGLINTRVIHPKSAISVHFIGKSIEKPR